MTEADSSQLAWGAAAIALIALAAFLLMPTPMDMHAPRLGSTFDDLKSPESIYTFEGTEVRVVKADVMRFQDDWQLEAIAFSTKENLGPPMRNSSIDGLVWTDLCENMGVDSPCSSEYQADRQRLWEEHRDTLTPGRPWVVAMPDVWRERLAKRRGWPATYFVAGISAQKDGTTHTSSGTIATGVESACSKAAEDGIRNLGLPLIGSGAAIRGATDRKLDQSAAVRALLEGVHAAAARGACPERVTLLLYPGLKSSHAIAVGRRADDGAEEADWLALGNTLAKAVHDGHSWMSAPSPWSTRRVPILVWQVSVILLGVLSSAMLALKLGARLTTGSVVQAMVVFSFLALGVKVGSSVAPAPVGPTAFVLLLLASVVVPVWRWKKLGDPIERDASTRSSGAHLS